MQADWVGRDRTSILFRGRNWQVPHKGPYTLRVRVEVPEFPRHDKINVKRFDQPVEVEFPNIKLEVGQKK